MGTKVDYSGFPPIVSESATVLVLGTMPGQESIRQQQYYAHPRNAFWAIMGVICGAQLRLPYEQRVERLQKVGIAVWDVLKHGEREGSLDSQIETETEVPNDINGLLNTFPGIRLVVFNGKKAEEAFYRHIWPGLSAGNRDRLTLARLPSTSPANASVSLEKKLRRWQACIGEFIRS